MSILFIGDIVGETGLQFLENTLEGHLKALKPTFVIANAENIAVTGHDVSSGCGMTPELLERLFDLGVDIVTGGNHSWDGPHGQSVHSDPRVLRPINFAKNAPGRGAVILERNGFQLGVINAAGRSALPQVDSALDALESQLDEWNGSVNGVLVDFHSESAMEKLTIAWAMVGRITACIGTHTHVPTLDTQVLPGGTAYVTDVGCTGPTGGIQGYQPEHYVEAMRSKFPGVSPLQVALGPVELGAVFIGVSGSEATSIKRIN